MNLLISYDLHQDQAYRRVQDLLEKWEAVQLLRSVWLVKRGGRAEDAMDELINVIAADDSLTIIELRRNADWALYNATDLATAWLKKHVTP